MVKTISETTDRKGKRNSCNNSISDRLAVTQVDIQDEEERLINEQQHQQQDERGQEEESSVGASPDHREVSGESTNQTAPSTCTGDIVMQNVTELMHFPHHHRSTSPLLTALRSTACALCNVTPNSSPSSQLHGHNCSNRHNSTCVSVESESRHVDQLVKCTQIIKDSWTDRARNKQNRRMSASCINDASDQIYKSDNFSTISKPNDDHSDNSLHSPSTEASSLSSTSSVSSLNLFHCYRRKIKLSINCKLIVYFVLISFILTFDHQINSLPNASKLPRIFKYQSMKISPPLSTLDKLSTISFAFQSSDPLLMSPVNNNNKINNNNINNNNNNNNSNNNNNNALLKMQVSSPLPPYFSTTSPSSSSSSISTMSTINSTANPLPDYCKVCRCQKKDSLFCKLAGDLTAIPYVRKETDRNIISEIIIENQPKLTNLTSDSLSGYPNVEKITISNTGLTSIAVDAFANNRKLKEINLKNNKLAEIPWKIFDGLTLLELTLTDNPLACNCGAKWIQKQIEEDDSVLGPEKDSINCTDVHTGERKSLSVVDISGCDAPSVFVTPEEVSLNETDDVVLNCTATGIPPPRVYWNVTSLRSSYTNETFKSLVTRNAVDSVEVTQLLNLKNITGADNGYVKCIAENIVGKSEDSASLLKINSVPRILELKMQKKFYWCISYKIAGYPRPDKSWLFNSNPLNLSESIQDFEVSSKSFFVYEGYLQIEKATPSNDGLYTLVVRNEFGAANLSVEAQFHKAEKVPVLPGGQGKPHLNLPGNAPDTGRIDNDDKREEPSDSLLVTWVSLGIATTLLLVAITFVLIVKKEKVPCYSVRKRKNVKNRRLVTRERIPLNGARLVDNPNYFGEKHISSNGNEIAHISREKISFIHLLGEGAFGRVFLGSVDYLTHDEPLTLVAAKTLKENNGEETRIEFEREAELLTNLKHPNIVTFYGISWDGDPYMMLFEYMEYGDLNNFLRTHGPDSRLINSSTHASPTYSKADSTIAVDATTSIQYTETLKQVNSTLADKVSDEAKCNDSRDTVTVANNEIDYMTANTTTNSSINRSQIVALDNRDKLLAKASAADRFDRQLELKDLYRMSVQIADGMKYLNAQHFVHRDLATRNCLVGENLVIKIGDFGMSRDVYSSDYYRVGRQTMLPIRWMPPESILYRKFTVESDIWSFGVVLWEIFTFGKQPWYELANSEVIAEVTRGKILAQPAGCPDEMYNLMFKCWQQPQERPSMVYLHSELSKLEAKAQTEKERETGYAELLDE